MGERPIQQADVKIETPKEEVKELPPHMSRNPSEILKYFFGRDVIVFHRIPKVEYDENAEIYRKNGYEYVFGLGLIPREQMHIAEKIMNEGWHKDPNFGFLSPSEYALLKSKNYI